MKHISMFQRLLAVVLALTMLGSVLIPASGAVDEPKKTEELSEESLRELPLTPVDPDALAPHQLDLGTDEETPAPADDYAPDEIVRVSIVLDKPSTIEAGYALDGIAENSAARSYRNRLKAEQTTVTKRIESATGSKLDVRWNLTLAANIISAEVPYGQIETIKALDGISDVFLESRYDPQTDEEDAAVPENGAASTMIGSQLAWAQGYTGVGSRIAIIDTGVDASHQSFSAEGLEYAFAQNADELGMSYDDYLASLDLLTADGIDAVLDQLNAAHVNSGTPLTSGAQAYRNYKVPFGYNYVDTNPNEIEHIHDTQGNHGSRVAGVAVANRFILSEGNYQPALDVAGMQGVAPDAQLVVMKVFGSHGGAYSSDYMSAIEDAIILGCDAANLSLGSSSPGFSFSDDYEYVLNEIVQSGMVVSNSAGNSGMWYRTPNNENMTEPYLYAEDNNYFTSGSPGTYTNSLSVAAAENGGHTGYPLHFGDRNVYYSETSGYTNEPIATLAGGEYGYVLLDNVGTTGEDGGDYFAQLGSEILNGKFAICRRGTSSFSLKANAAMAQGATGLIVINNDAGLVNMKLSDYTYTNPAVSISMADGEAVLAQSESHTAGGGLTYYTGTLSVLGTLTVDYAEPSDTIDIYSNSSYGTPGSMVLKPEILAPGGTIYSTDGEYDSGGGDDQYTHSSGTSLAAPQIAGMAGVLGQYIRENDLCTSTGLTQRQLINSLLMSTAHPVYDADGNYWPVFRVGAGLPNINDALNAKAYVLMDEDATMFPDSARDGKVKAELGDDPARTGEYEFSFTVYPLDNDRAYTFRTELFTQAIAGDFGYGLLQDTATTRMKAEVTYEIGGDTYADDYVLNADVNLDGAMDDADAQAILDYLTGKLPGGAPFNAAAADVDGDGSITTRDAWKILDAEATPAAEISGPVKVTVHIKLDPDEMATLLQSFPNGFYVEGYTYLLSVDDGEGAMDVTHSIPIYGYCGSWTDANMLDRTSPVKEAYGIGKEPYTGVKNTNYMSVISAQGSSVIYAGNPYEVENSFPTERLAMNSSRYINSFTYLNIRNVATIGFAVTAEDGSVLYAQATPIQKYGAYYYSDGGTWRNTGSASYTVGKTLNQMGAQEGDRVTVGFYALPEYYGIQYAKMNDTVATSGKLDTAGFTAVLNAGIVGENAGIKYSVVIDNTAPEISAVELDLSGTDLSVSYSDNNYVAWVALLNQSGSVVYASDVPSQPGPGEPVDFHFDLTDLDLPSKVTVLVADYAGNETAYLVQIKEEEPTPPACFAFTSASGAPGSGNRVLDIDIATLTYNDQTQAYEGLGVYSEIPFVVQAAEYVNNYVFIAANDGCFYVASVFNLNAPQRVGRFSDTTDTIYDLAFNYQDNKLYALGKDNNIYSVDLNTCAMTKVLEVTITNPKAAAQMYQVLKDLAIDDEGNFYAANYGSASYTFAYRFTLGMANSEDKILDLAPINDSTSGAIGYYNYYGGCMAWDHDNDRLYMVSNYMSNYSGTQINNSNTDYDNCLLVINTSNDSAERANTASATTKYCAMLFNACSGLIITPATTGSFEPAETATELIVEPTSLNLQVGQTADLITVVRPWTLTEGGLTFVSGNDGIASVSEDGAVTGVGTGNTTITVSTKAAPHLTATIPVNVSNSTGSGGGGGDVLHAPSMGAFPEIIRAIESNTVVDDDTVTVVLTEDQDVNNGLIKITGFDRALTLVSAESTLPYYSVSTGTDTITLAYASAEIIPAGTPLIKLTFSYGSFGIDTEIDTETLERNSDLGLNGETTAIPIQKLHVHSYGPVEWVWSTDCTSATAKFTCACGNVEEIPAAVDVQTTALDCTTGGQAVYTASARFNSTDYSDTKTVDLDPLGHAYAGVVTPPTCTTAGFTTYACSRCGHQYTGDETAALKHDWNDGEITIAAGCTAAGLETFTCKRCGAIRTAAINPNGHTERTVAAIPATCTTAGQTAGKDCSVCGAILEGMELVLPTGHTPVIDEAVAATCTASGKTAGSHCSVCEAVLVEQAEVPALGHKSEVMPAVAPTCTEAGLTEGAKCSRCGEILTAQETVKALGHDWNEGETTIAAGCTAAGLETFTCKRCGAIRTAAINPNGHTERTVAAIPATCTTAGQTAGKDCSVCGAILEGMELILPTGHTPVIDEALAATCTATGLTAGSHCSVCEAVLVEQAEVPALGHKSEVIPAVAPTCTETGLTEGAKCSVCGEILTEPVEIAALGHTVVTVPAVAATCTEAGLTEGSYCSVCGAVLTAQEPVDALGHAWTDIRYEWSEDGRQVTATATCEHDPSHTLSETADAQFILTQPSTFEKPGTGYYIAAFEQDAFETQIRFVTIPEVSCDGGETCPSRTFTDMPPVTNFAHIPIDWAILNQVTLGVTPTAFCPADSCTRAQVVTFLWRLNGQPEPEGKENPFLDVKEGDYFYNAVLWAVEKGITDGTSATTFSPDDGCTRAQVVTFLWRAEGKPEPTSSFNPFTDVKAGSYYYTAVLWAVEDKITTGTSAITFSPDEACNRAQIVTFLYRAFAG